MDPQTLQSIGLTQNESIIYLTLLQHGTLKAGEVVNKSGINSGKIYEILESLEKKGLVGESNVNRVRYFTASAPTRILDFLEQKKKEIAKEEQLVKAELGKLETMRKSSLKTPRSVTYLGFSGIKAAAEEILGDLSKDDEVLAMGITEKKDSKYSDFWFNWSMQRAERGIKGRHIYSERGDFFKKSKSLPLTKVKVIEGITPVTVNTFGKNKVLLLNFKEPSSCTLIYDENTAQSFINFFNQLWSIAK